MGRYFYVSSVNGKDENTGTSEENAWRSLARVNQMTFGPGDHICFERGGKWRGMLEPRGDGSEFSLITAEPYGDGDAPEIDGAGEYAAIYLKGVSHWKVTGLKVCNHAEERAVRQGICICGKPQGITENIEISGCEIYEVEGENRRSMPVYHSMYWNGAVYVTFPGRTSDENHLHDIRIQFNKIHDVRTSGVRVNQQEDFINDIHHTHVVVRGNEIRRTGTDGIIVANCISPLIDSNRVFDAGALGTLEDTQLIAGVWVCATSNALIQRNEVAGTRMFENDGTAFDTDWGTAGDTIFQYNYTHDNEGGFWLDCMKLNYNRGCRSTILRYNISINDGRGLAVYDQGIPAEWYGNVFYAEKPVTICCFDEGENFRFTGNVFVLKQGTDKGWQKCSYEGNVYYTQADRPETEGTLDPDAKAEWEKLLSSGNLSREQLGSIREKLCRLVQKVQ